MDILLALGRVYSEIVLCNIYGSSIPLWSRIYALLEGIFKDISGISDFFVSASGW